MCSGVVKMTDCSAGLLNWDILAWCHILETLEGYVTQILDYNAPNTYLLLWMRLEVKIPLTAVDCLMGSNMQSEILSEAQEQFH